MRGLLIWRPGYALAALLVFLIEVGIALWVRDGFVRPYLGDVLAVVLVYLVLRALTALRVVPAALMALAVGVAVEAGQALHLLDHLGLAGNRVARVVLGSAFSIGDLFCYGAGAVLVIAGEGVRGAAIRHG